MYSSTRIKKLISKLADTEVALLKAKDTITQLETKLKATDVKVAETEVKVTAIEDSIKAEEPIEPIKEEVK